MLKTMLKVLKTRLRRAPVCLVKSFLQKPLTSRTGFCTIKTHRILCNEANREEIT
nr:hypothetical protein BRACLTYN_BRACLTYN_CDS_0012 [Microvirus sp.]